MSTSTTAPTLYAFDPHTGLYIGSFKADPDEQQPGKWLKPAYTTDQAPPSTGANEAAVFKNGAWSVVPDWRGHVYWLADGSEHTIDQLDVTPPADALDAAPNPPLATLQQQATAAIDTAAGAARARYITTVPGQEGTYQIKAAETDAYVSAGRPTDASSYPMLSAEASARNMTVSALADEIRTTRDNWTQQAAQIEGARMKGKTAVEACTAADPTAPTDAEAQDVTDARDTAVANLEAI